MINTLNTKSLRLVAGCIGGSRVSSVRKRSRGLTPGLQIQAVAVEIATGFRKPRHLDCRRELGSLRHLSVQAKTYIRVRGLCGIAAKVAGSSVAN